MKIKREKYDCEYDETSIQSIFEYARMLEGRVISDVVGSKKLENNKDRVWWGMPCRSNTSRYQEIRLRSRTFMRQNWN